MDVALDMELINCKPNSGGYPDNAINTILAQRETDEADELRQKNQLKYGKTIEPCIHESHAKDLEMNYLWDDTFESLEERLQKNEEN